MPFESAHVFRRRCFNRFLSSTMVKSLTSQSPVVSISRTKLLRSADSKPISDAKIFSRKFANSPGPGYSSSFFVEQGWVGTRAWWVKRSKSLNSSKTCWIRPFLCSRSARRRCFRIDLDIYALCDFDLAILCSTSKSWKTWSYHILIFVQDVLLQPCSSVQQLGNGENYEILSYIHQRLQKSKNSGSMEHHTSWPIAAISFEFGQFTIRK